MIARLVPFAAAVLVAAVASARAADPAPVPALPRPAMRALPPESVRSAPPSARDLVDARAELKQRFGEMLTRARSVTAAALAADMLIEEAAAEENRGLKWAMLDEARRLAVRAGNAATIERAVVQASATYEFDDLDVEYRSLSEMPLRGLSRLQAAALAEVAEKVAGRAEADGRQRLAASALSMAYRAWQRAGLEEPARRVEARLDAVTSGR
jgi:hypothetical protein